MPNIVAYVHAYVPEHNAGAETTMHDLLKHLVSTGWEAHVVIRDRSGLRANDYVLDGVNVHQASDKRSLLHYLPKADVSISHLECSERLHLLSNSYKIPTVHLVHNTHKLTKKWMSYADGLIVNSEWVRNEPDFVGNKPAMVLNPPVNPEEYRTTRGKSITLVNLWEDKGAKIFYEMAERFPELPFLGVKGGYGVQVTDYAKSNVTIMEHTKDMKKVYGETKVILMPSKYESFGRVGVEALASGIPTIAEPTPGLLESLGDAGTFADRNNPDEWEKALRELLKPAKYGKQSKLAKARSEELATRRTDQLLTVNLFLGELLRIGKVR